MSEAVQPQTVFADRYVIGKELGRGGMATVYLAHDLKNDRDVAVKVLHADLGAALGTERFEREIHFVSRFSHPNILAVDDSGQTNGQLWYVMPLVRGETLRSRLDREKQLPLADAVKITCEVAEALHYAHEQGIIHRDIKPENILLEDGHAIVADFGIARAASALGERQLTQTGVTLGTPAYMSPEQGSADKTIDGRADIYSLGCVLYELLAGEPPFGGPTAQVIIARHSLAEVPALSIARGTVPEELEDAILRSLAKAPADRFATALEFSEALKESLASGGKSLGRADRRSRSRRRGKGKPRNRRQFLITGAIAVSVLGIAGWVGAQKWRALRHANSAALGLEPKRIAVLYFEDKTRGNLGPVADGLSEALIDQLSGVQALDVISRNGVAPFRQSKLSVDSIANSLKAGTLVQGTVDTTGGRVRVEVQLIDGNSGVSLNRENFDLPAASILTVRDSVASEVARFLRERVGTEVRLREQRRSTTSAEAWTLVQQGERARKSAEERLAAKDPAGAFSAYQRADSALLRAEQIDANWSAPIIMQGEIAGRIARLPAEQAHAAKWIDAGLNDADRALKLDPKDARALQLRGALRYFRYQLRLEPNPANAAALLDGAEADLKAATTIDKNLASAWASLSAVYSMKSNLVDSKLAAQRAYEADAYLVEAPSVVYRLAVTSLDLEQLRDAQRYCDEGYRRFPADARFVRCRIWLLGAQTAAAKVDTSDITKAWNLVEDLHKRTPDAAWELAGRVGRMWTAAVIARAGLADSARHVLAANRGNDAIDPDGELLGAEVYVLQLLGDRDQAIERLKLYLSEHPEHRAGLAESRSWVWRDLHNDPRFRDLVGATR
ncbi:MAG TPA: protein kinase [Gemmatimonadaceae bacterium]|jgi:TolB-like protein/tetratricopeptide (TPR) repeat protein|nr:protein kinase [Gemmatimonadaceae bacterium]